MKEKKNINSNILYLQLRNDALWKNEKQIQTWLKTLSEEKLFSLFIETYTAYHEDMKNMPTLVGKETQLSGQIKYKEKSIPFSEDTDMDEIQLKIHLAELIHERRAVRLQIDAIQNKWSILIKERLEKIAMNFFSFSMENDPSFYQITVTPRPEIQKINADKSSTVSRKHFASFFDLKENHLLFSPFLQIVFAGYLLGMKNQQPCILDSDNNLFFLHDSKTEKSSVFLKVFPAAGEFERNVLRQTLLKEVLFLSSLWLYYEKMGKCSATYDVVVFKEKAGLNEEENMEDVVSAFANGDESLMPLAEIHGVFDFSLKEYRDQGLLKSRRMKEQPEWLKTLNPFFFIGNRQMYVPVLYPSQNFCDTLEEKEERDVVLFLQKKEIEFASLLLFNEVEGTSSFPF